MSTLSVANIATDDDLIAEVASEAKLARAMSRSADRDAVRTLALNDVVAALAQRSPPIFEADLADQTQLKNAVVYRSLVRIFRSARTTLGDAFDALARDYDKEYQTAVRAPFTVNGSLTGPSGFSFSLERR